MTTCALYLRLSQDRSGEGAGVERQERECRDLAERLGLTVGLVYTDNDVSATTGRLRSGFEALLNAKPEAILCWHQDRLLRLTKDLERVIALDIPVYTVTAGTLDLTNPAGRAVARTVAAWSQYEGEQKATRQRAANKQKAEQGQPNWARRPFGYNMDQTINEREASLVREAYRNIIDGGALWATCRQWNAAGERTTRGNEWTASSLRTLLRASRNAGLRVYRGSEYKASWQALVNRDTWEALCAATNGRAPMGPKQRRGLLSGLATCYQCGTTLGLGLGNKVRIYRCRSGAHLARAVTLIDNAVIAEAINLLVLPGLAERMADTERPDADALRAERAHLEARRTEWLQSGMAPKDVATALAPLDARIAEITNALVGNVSENPFAEWWTNGDDEQLPPTSVFNDLPLHARQALLQGLFASITPQPGRGSGVLVELTDRAVQAKTAAEAQADKMGQIAGKVILQRFAGKH